MKSLRLEAAIEVQKHTTREEKVLAGSNQVHIVDRRAVFLRVTVLIWRYVLLPSPAALSSPQQPMSVEQPRRVAIPWITLLANLPAPLTHIITYIFDVTD